MLAEHHVTKEEKTHVTVYLDIMYREMDVEVSFVVVQFLLLVVVVRSSEVVVDFRHFSNDFSRGFLLTNEKSIDRI